MFNFSDLLILVTYGHPVNRTLLACKLGLSACRASYNGKEALACECDRQFFLIITDCDMSKIDGYALVLIIHAAPSRYGTRCSQRQSRVDIRFSAQRFNYAL